MKKISIFFTLVYAREKSSFWNDDALDDSPSRQKRSERTSSLTDADLEADYHASIHKSDLTILMWPWAETRDSVVWDLPKSWQFSNVIESSVLPQHCGSCMLTNNKLYAKSANAAFIQTTALFGHLGHIKGLHAKYPDRKIDSFPSPYKRPRSQYWMGWFKESASKGFESIPYLRADIYPFGGFDSAFNLTMDVRRDSDVYCAHNGNVHQVYTKQVEIMDKYGIENEEILPHKTSSSLAAAIISNCDKTPQAKLRMKAVNALVEAGLTLTGTGRCFKDHPRHRF